MVRSQIIQGWQPGDMSPTLEKSSLRKAMLLSKAITEMSRAV